MVSCWGHMGPFWIQRGAPTERPRSAHGGAAPNALAPKCIPLPPKLQRSQKNCFMGAAQDIFLKFCAKVTSQGYPKSLKLQYSHWNIAISPSCPKIPKWCQRVPKKLQSETLELPQWFKVVPSGTLRAPRGAQSDPKCPQMCKRVTLGNVLEHVLDPKWPNCLTGHHFWFVFGRYRPVPRPHFY